jgi:intracellular septation protein
MPNNNIFFDIIPLIIFFAAYYATHNLFLATGLCIIASWVVLIIAKIKYHRINKNMWLSTILITVFGGLTIILHNKTFVMLKPTILFWILGASLIASHLAGKNLLRMSLGAELKLDNKTWGSLNLAWGIFFLIMGGVNLFVALNFSEEVWVKFKVFGSLGLSIAFAIISALVIYVKQSLNNANNTKLKR